MVKYEWKKYLLALALLEQKVIRKSALAVVQAHLKRWKMGDDACYSVTQLATQLRTQLRTQLLSIPVYSVTQYVILFNWVMSTEYTESPIETQYSVLSYSLLSRDMAANPARHTKSIRTVRTGGG